MTYTLGEKDGKTVVRLVHDQFAGDEQTYANVTEGWPVILGRLKTHVEGGDK